MKEKTPRNVEQHIRYYKPKGWVGTIHEFDFVPYISDEDFEVIKRGKIPQQPYAKKWYVVDAIKDWMKNNLTLPTNDDMLHA